MKRLGLLIGGSLLLWGLLAYPGWYLQGEPALIQSAVALSLCLVPAVATYLWAARAFRGSPQTQALAMFGGSGFRMFLVLGVGYGLMLWRSDVFSSEFWIWVLIFYLATLALEVWILVQISEPKDASDGPPAAP